MFVFTSFAHITNVFILVPESMMSSTKEQLRGDSIRVRGEDVLRSSTSSCLNVVRFDVVDGLEIHVNRFELSRSDTWMQHDVGIECMGLLITPACSSMHADLNINSSLFTKNPWYAGT